MTKPNAFDSCRLYVGTSGYSYKEWMDAGFYPAGIRSGQMLSFYAERFPIIFNNHVRAQAVENAFQMIRILAEEGLGVR